jgi:hypothetical protein
VNKHRLFGNTSLFEPPHDPAVGVDPKRELRSRRYECAFVDALQQRRVAESFGDRVVVNIEANIVGEGRMASRKPRPVARDRRALAPGRLTRDPGWITLPVS